MRGPGTPILWKCGLPPNTEKLFKLTLELVPILGVVSSGFLRTFRDPGGDVSLLSVEPFLLSFLLPKVFSCFVLFIFFSNFSWDFDLDLLAAWSISLSLCEAVLPNEDILFVDPVMKLSNDPVKLPLNASPLRLAEGENIGPASLANLRSALCTEYRLPDDTDRCSA